MSYCLRFIRLGGLHDKECYGLIFNLLENWAHAYMAKLSVCNANPCNYVRYSQLINNNGNSQEDTTKTCNLCVVMNHESKQGSMRARACSSDQNQQGYIYRSENVRGHSIFPLLQYIFSCSKIQNLGRLSRGYSQPMIKISALQRLPYSQW